MVHLQVREAVVAPETVADRVAVRDRPGGPRSHLGEAAFWVALGAAVVPVLVAAIRASVTGWYPTGDDGFAGLRAQDVFSAHPPLLGTWSSASGWSHQWINHPGPAQFFALAIPVKLLGVGVGVAIGTALTNVAAIVAAVLLARRRAGPVFGAVAALFIATVAWTFGPSLLFDPWSQHAPMFPFVLLLFAVWSVLDGDVGVLWLAVVAGSFVLQTHLSYILLVPGLWLLALAGWALTLHGGRIRRRRAFASLGVAVVALLLCWLPPIYEQLTVHPGNLTGLVRAARTTPPKTPGLGGAIQAVGDVVATPPLWLRSGWTHPAFHPHGSGRPVALLVMLLVLVGAAGVWLLVLAHRRRDRLIVAGLATAAAAVMLGAASVVRMTSPYGLVRNYVQWLWLVSMFTWLMMGLAAARALRRSGRPAAAAVERVPARASALGVAALAVVVAGLNIPYTDTGTASPPWSVPAAKQLFRQALPSLRHRGTVLVDLPPDPLSLMGDATFSIGPALLAQLRSHGIDFVIRDPANDHSFVRQVGAHRRWDGHNAAAELTILHGPDAEAPAGSRRIAYWPGISRAEQAERLRLQAALVQRVRELGGIRLAPNGRKLAAKGWLDPSAVTAVSGSARRPEALFYRDRFAVLVEVRAIDIGALGPRAARYASLTHDLFQRTVAFVLGPPPSG